MSSDIFLTVSFGFSQRAAAAKSVRRTWCSRALSTFSRVRAHVPGRGLFRPLPSLGPAHFHPPQAPNLFDPADALFHPFANHLAGLIVLRPRGASVQAFDPVVRPLGHVRRDALFPAEAHELRVVVVLVGPDALRRSFLFLLLPAQQDLRRFGFGGAGGRSDFQSRAQAMAVFSVT